MKVFYRNAQSAVGTTYFSPSPRKPALVVAEWKKRYSVEIETFEPVTRDQLKKVHKPEYVDGVLDGRINNGFGDKDERIIKVLPYVAGSMVAATLHAFKTGETAFSPTSGAHHACYSHGGGFCTFNFLSLAAAEAYEAGAKRVGIADCDVHHGNGTMDIRHKLGMHFLSHYSFAHRCGDAEEWLESFPSVVAAFVKELDVLIYNAGADAHINDPLGHVLTTEQMKLRDMHVFNEAAKAGVPVAISLAGGYQNPIDPVIEIHCNTYEEATKYQNHREEKMAA
jgi:acetoin utilization deacetylase AcuC-like enzyme